MLEDVYASSDVNIVMMMFFELFYSEKFPSSQAGLEKKSSKNIIITNLYTVKVMCRKFECR